jgi:hypothetical protein
MSSIMRRLFKIFINVLGPHILGRTYCEILLDSYLFAIDQTGDSSRSGAQGNIGLRYTW